MIQCACPHSSGWRLVIVLPADLPPDTFLGERWVVDELLEMTATVLVAEGLASTPAFATVAQVVAHHGEAGAAEVATVFSAIGLAEEVDSDVWFEEVSHVIPVDTLADFFSERWTGLASGGRRALQEGDVFWVVLPRPSPDGPVLWMGKRGDEERVRQRMGSPTVTGDALRARALDFRRQQGWIVDVTEIAIERVLRAYDSALRAGSDANPTVGTNG